MKKYLFFAATALALASCSSDDYLGNNPGNENGANNAINFSSNTAAVTRASQLDGAGAAEALGNNFVVVGFKGSETTKANTTLVFDHYNVNYKTGTAGTTDSNTKDWEYVGQAQEVRGTDPAKKLAGDDVTAQTIKYWDRSAKSYDFLAFSMGKGTGDDANKAYAVPTAVQKNNLKDGAYTLSGTANTLKECYISDMKTVLQNEYSTQAVQLQFRHLNSKVRLAFFETVPGYVISDVKFYADETTDENSDIATLYGTFNNHGTMTVSFPTTGTDNSSNPDYNKAHVAFTSNETDATVNKMEFAKITYNNQDEDHITKNSGFMSQDKSQPSYCGTSAADAYVNVLPMEDKSQPATIRIDYKLTSSDGSNEVINVKGATAVVPAKYTAWKPGYAYTYIFKIAQNTNGSTNPDDPNKGLTAISFDAVVMDDEVSGQETVTTVSDPSITTYGWNPTTKKVTVDGNEYAAGTEIYATVHIPATAGENATEASTEAPQKLYTVTLSDAKNAAQTINESSVANCIAKNNVTGNEGSKVYTVKDANDVTMTVTETAAETVATVPTEDGHNLKVNALKWTGAANTYAVEYTDKDGKKSYKIVNVK